MKNCIVFPAQMSEQKAIEFWEKAGYKLNKDFVIRTPKYGLPEKYNQKIIVAKKQMILAQDDLRLGFLSLMLHTVKTK